MAVIEITNDNFEKEVLRSDVPVVVDFNATWCGPCRMMKPVLEELSSEGHPFKIAAVDVDENDELAEEYGISSIPCLVVIRDGVEVKRSVGLVSKDAVIALAEG